MTKSFNGNVPAYWEQKDVQEVRKAQSLEQILTVAKRIYNRVAQISGAVFDETPFTDAIDKIDSKMVKKFQKAMKAFISEKVK